MGFSKDDRFAAGLIKKTQPPPKNPGDSFLDFLQAEIEEES